MIISDSVGSLRTWRPLITTIGLLLIWDTAVTVLYYAQHMRFDGIDIQFSLYGTAVALFVGFLVNAAYGRWWEARTLWGQVVNSSRSLARQALVLLDDDARAMRVEIIQAQVAYVHVLRTALRRQPLPPEAGKYLPASMLANVHQAANPATVILVGIDQVLTRARRSGVVDEFSRVQMEATLVALTDAQGGLERIKNTPLPVHYRFLPRFFSRAFCLILPFAVVKDLGLLTPVGSGLIGLMFLIAVKVGDDLSDPFSDSMHDIPMTALCRTIEIDLLTLLGEEAPAHVTAQNKVLW